MPPQIFVILVTLLSLFPCTKFRPILFSQHTFLVATASHAPTYYLESTNNKQLIGWIGLRPETKAGWQGKMLPLSSKTEVPHTGTPNN